MTADDSSGVRPAFVDRRYQNMGSARSGATAQIAVARGTEGASLGGSLMTLDIPADDFGGYIFDCDGTLVDTMPLHYRAWNAAMQRHGLRGELDEELFYSLGGVPTRRVAELMGAHYGLSLDPDHVFHEKEDIFLSMQGEMKVIQAVVDFAIEAAKRAPVAVASGGPKPIVRRTLEVTGLSKLFPILVTPEDVVHGKPAPDMFLLAAAKMGVAPAACLVFEDADPGFRAAEAAGMKWVAVTSRPVKRQ